MAVTVFAEGVARRYEAPVCSLAFAFSLVMGVGALVVPFYVAFAAKNFWLKTNTYLEQPEVGFAYDVLVIAQGFAPDGAMRTWAWASKAGVREVYEPFLRASVLQAWSTDDNADGTPDAWAMTLQMPLMEGERVHSLQALVGFEYALSGAAALDMDGLAYLEHSSPIPGLSLRVEGEARLHQRRALSVRRENAHPDLRFATGAEPTLQSHNIGALLGSYAARNFTMEVAHQYKVWGVGQQLDSFSRTADSFCLNFTLRVPTDEIVYTPDLAEVLKVAWMQYFSLAALFYVAFRTLSQFVFANQVLETVVRNEGPTYHSRIKKARF